MIGEFTQFIKTKKLFAPADKVLLAVSGGVDSMVMLDLFRKAGFRFGIVHCNFGLRGAESDADEEFIRQAARANRYELYVERFNTMEYAKQTKSSVQMAARELRYDYFEKIRVKKGFRYIATAHNLNDSAETFLFHISRGTGISGLKGIPVRSGHVVRPLLFASRDMIMEYARSGNISWREDSSNLSLKYKRNLIRHKLIPEFRKLNPNFLRSLSSTMERLGSSENLILKWIAQNRDKWSRTKKGRTFIGLEGINKWKEPALIYFMIRDFGYSFEQAVWILNSSVKRAGAQFYSSTHILTCDRNMLIIEMIKDSQDLTWQIRKGQKFLDTGQDEQFTFNLILPPGDLKTPPHTALFDESKLIYPMVIRTPKRGDKFRPLGMKGEQKLSDFMINNKVPRNLKRNIRIITSNNIIVWVAGYRISEDFKVKEDTKRVLKIEYTQS